MLVLPSMYAITDSATYTLVCHPQTSIQAVRGIDVVVEETTRGSLLLTFSLAGDISSLSVPESGLSRRADHLWKHTCFEAFVMAGEGPGYFEFNFSPSGAWAVYAFRDYRKRRALEIESNPGMVLYKSPNLLELGAEIGRNFIPRGGPLRLGLTAVVEDAEGGLSYWALQHPPGNPDFHHIDCFMIER